MTARLTGMGIALALGSSMATAAAQSGTMDKKSDKMMGKSMSMTGCVEAGSTAGSYMLTHADMGKMSKDKMGTEKMDADKTGMSDNVMLTGTSVDLSKHVGHKVKVTGSKGADGMMVKSVKMIASTCP